MTARPDISARRFIADGQAGARTGCGMILASDGIEVTSEAADGAGTVAAVRRTRPGVAVLRGGDAGTARGAVGPRRADGIPGTGERCRERPPAGPGGACRRTPGAESAPAPGQPPLAPGAGPSPCVRSASPASRGRSKMVRNTIVVPVLWIGGMARMRSSRSASSPVDATRTLIR